MIKDIELIQTDSGGYDWSFNLDDLNTVQYDKQLESAVVHAVMLKPYEVESNEYLFKGNTAYNYLLDKPTEHVLKLIEDGIKTSCEEIKGVSDAKIEVTNNETTVSINIIILKNNGEEVLIDGISIG